MSNKYKKEKDKDKQFMRNCSYLFATISASLFLIFLISLEESTPLKVMVGMQVSAWGCFGASLFCRVKSWGNS